MERVKLDGIELEYEVVGAGSPVLLIHGSHIAGAFLPLLAEPSLADRYQLVRYHRRGFAGSTKPTGSFSIADQAADAAGVLDALGIAGAHVAGHSYGGAIGLELAATAPDRVQSLALLEPGLLAVPSAPAFFELVTPAIETYGKGDHAGAVNHFMSLVGGEDWQATTEATVPGGPAQAMKDATTFFEIEMPALQAWTFGPERAATVRCPVLSVLGGESPPLFAEGRALLHEWFPACADADIANADHLLQMGQPAAVAEALRAFLDSTG